MEPLDCICTALHTNVGCAKHGRSYLLSFHRTLPNPVIRLEILAAAFTHEDYFGGWPNHLYIRKDEWAGLMEGADDFTFDKQMHTYNFLGMDVEFIPYGDLRVGFSRYV